MLTWGGAGPEVTLEKMEEISVSLALTCGGVELVAEILKLAFVELSGAVVHPEQHCFVGFQSRKEGLAEEELLFCWGGFSFLCGLV